MYKKLIPTLLILFLFSITVSGYTLENGKVSLDNEFLNIECDAISDTPSKHHIQDPCILTPKMTGKANVTFEFDNDGFTKGKIFRYEKVDTNVKEWIPDIVCSGDNETRTCQDNGGYEESIIQKTEKVLRNGNSVSTNFNDKKQFTFKDVNFQDGIPQKLRLEWKSLASQGKYRIIVWRGDYQNNPNILLDLDPWFNNSWTKCKEFDVNDTSNLKRDLMVVNKNFTGLTFTDDYEIRILNQSCNGDDGVEVPRSIISSGTDWVFASFYVDIPANAQVKYSVYYDNPTAVNPEPYRNTPILFEGDFPTANQGHAQKPNRAWVNVSTPTYGSDYITHGTPYGMVFTNQTENYKYLLQYQTLNMSHLQVENVNTNTATSKSRLYLGNWSTSATELNSGYSHNHQLYSATDNQLVEYVSDAGTGLGATVNQVDSLAHYRVELIVHQNGTITADGNLSAVPFSRDDSASPKGNSGKHAGIWHRSTGSKTYWMRFATGNLYGDFIGDKDLSIGALSVEQLEFIPAPPTIVYNVTIPSIPVWNSNIELNLTVNAPENDGIVIANFTLFYPNSSIVFSSNGTCFVTSTVNESICISESYYINSTLLNESDGMGNWSYTFTIEDELTNTLTGQYDFNLNNTDSPLVSIFHPVGTFNTVPIILNYSVESFIKDAPLYAFVNVTTSLGIPVFNTTELNVSTNIQALCNATGEGDYIVTITAYETKNGQNYTRIVSNPFTVLFDACDLTWTAPCESCRYQDVTILSDFSCIQNLTITSCNYTIDKFAPVYPSDCSNFTILSEMGGNTFTMFYTDSLNVSGNVSYNYWAKKYNNDVGDFLFFFIMLILGAGLSAVAIKTGYGYIHLMSGIFFIIASIDIYAINVYAGWMLGGCALIYIAVSVLD